MTQQIETVMTKDPKTVDAGDTVADAAKIMRDADIGDVIVVDGEQVAGIVTDRDVAVRAVAEGHDADSTPVSEICTSDVTALEADRSVDDAVKAMRDQDIRRLPVVKDGKPVGIVSLGDLAVEQDSDSALADISAASPNN